MKFRGDGFMENSGQVSRAGFLHTIAKAVNGQKEEEGIREVDITVEIQEALQELENIRNYFDTVREPELIDYAIYREKAILIRISYLLRKAKGQISKAKTSNL